MTRLGIAYFPIGAPIARLGDAARIDQSPFTQWIHAIAITILPEAFATDPEHLDGKRAVVFLFNFFDELRRKVPLGR